MSLQLTGNEVVEFVARSKFTCTMCPDGYLAYECAEELDILQSTPNCNIKFKGACWVARRRRDGSCKFDWERNELAEVLYGALCLLMHKYMATGIILGYLT